jgi:hypothetical protein
MINVDSDKNIIETFSNLLLIKNKKIYHRFAINNDNDFKITFTIIVNKKSKYHVASITDYDYPNWNTIEKYVISYYFYIHSFFGKVLSLDIETTYTHKDHESEKMYHIIKLSDREFHECYNKTSHAHLKRLNKNDIDDKLKEINDIFKDHNNIINTIEDL